MLRADSEGKMISVGSFTGTGNDQDRNELCIPFNHAFSVIRVHDDVIDSRTGESHRLVEMRNPWGEEYYCGPWGDFNDGDYWTEELRDLLDHQSEDDGKYLRVFHAFRDLH